MKIKKTFNFIYTMHYNGLVVIFYILSNINMVPKLNHPFLTCWNHYSWITFYIHNKLHARPHWNELVIFHIFLTFNMCIWIEPFNFNMLKLLLTSYILHVLKYIETHAIQCVLIYLSCKFYTSLELSTSIHESNHAP